jgi:hypothetical protein
MLKNPWLAAVLMSVSLASCGTADAFACSEESECPDGRWATNGYCSVPSDACPSGRRFGEFSGRFSGECVDDTPEDDATSGPGPSTATGGGSGLPPGTTATPPDSDSDSTGTSGPSSTDDTGIAPGCADGSVCLEIPDGWDGPVRLFADDQACSDVVAEGALSYAGDWSCACSCDADVPESCEDATGQIQLFDGSGCQGAPAQVHPLTNTCEAFGGGELFSVLATAGGPTTCTTSAVLDTQPIEPSEHQTLCNVASQGACPGGTCTADAPDLCIHAPGDLDCPDGWVRTLLYETYDDNRSCSGCTCDAAYACGGTYTMPNQACGQSGSLTMAMGSCSGAQFSVRGGWIASATGTPSSQCSTAGGTTSGAVLASTPRTVCCPP